ncbi:Zn-dependent protease with chaperone function [Chitinophaga niastensis]|uniref:Zn-dependent protease with chaperone function n=1 Tax=Chitinophaga niastensis TaxID=536980 RepID=A0A2P8HUY3_CHINA|nr:M48 family metallopeptidase [Chitinophaga niastensis]PSL50033.1 Zn-dependent protease with chaperone function [Chitinophaga niastensis]
MTNLYPVSPGNADPVLIQPTLLFKQRIIKVISCVVLFFLLYIVLLLTAVALAISGIAGGIVLFRAYPTWITGIISLSLMLLGGMVLFFLIKFLFNKRQPTNPYRTQIHANSHPQLFDFITQLVKDTRISFPKKIFVVPDVSATVFYNSSFLSLFWPVRKNLEIGLGLVNSVNISEFKMALANEFGHFSQRSMKLGSYVYALNKMLYNMLYENDNWNELVIRWGSAGSLFSFFAHVTTRVVNVMQFLLRKIYHLINRQYLELSREMEFHADALAVSLSGTAAAMSSMRRAEIGSYCLDHCLHKLPELAEKALRFRNIFKVQRALIQYYAAQHHAVLDDAALPVIPDTYFHTFLKSRVQLRDQWTSHPTREAREARYLLANVSCEQINTSAWDLFNEPESLQEHVTALIYDFTTPADETFNWITPAGFIEELTQRHRLYEYPKSFNDYYDNRTFASMDAASTQLLMPEEAHSCTLRTIYHPDIITRMRSFYRDQQDVETLQAIGTGQFQTRYFEFDGQKYRAGKAPRLANKLSARVQEELAWLLAHDRLAYRYHYTMAMRRSPAMAIALTDKYQEILQHQQTSNRLSDQVIRIIHCISQLFNTNGCTIEALAPSLDELSAECWNFRKLVQDITTSSNVSRTLLPVMEEKLKRFRLHDCVFIKDMVPDYMAIKELHEISSAMMEHYNNSIILLKKSYLEFILTLESAG